MEIVIDVKNRDEQETIKNANSITLAQDQDSYTIGDLFRIIEELTWSYHNLEEEFEDYKQMIEDNYKPIDPYSMYGVSANDFH